MKTDLPIYDSMTACAAGTGIPLPMLRKAKRAGCPAFRSNRVYLGELLRWMFTQDNDSATANWGDELRKWQARRQELKHSLEAGELIRRSWVAQRIVVLGSRLTAIRLTSEAEHPMLFASTNGDPAACRTVVRRIWNEILDAMNQLGEHLVDEPASRP